MPKKISKSNKTSIKKGIGDAIFTPIDSAAGVTVKALSALRDRSLTPQDCYTLDISTRTAIQAIATNISKARVRIFSRATGDEITGGALYEFLRRPCPKMSMPQWLNEMVSHYCIWGEMAAAMLLRGVGRGEDKTLYPSGVPVGLLPLNPSALHEFLPLQPVTLDDVQQWRYQWPNGSQTIYDTRLIMFEKGFNPSSMVRGLSPLITGVNEVSSSFYATRYNANKFKNGGIPSHLLILPEGSTEADREDFESRYLEQYGVYGGNSHKVMVVSGKDVKVEKLEEATKDGDYMALQEWNQQRIASLYKVPASEFGIYTKERYQTAAQERKIFFENTLLPLMNRISEMLQIQLVDQFFAGTLKEAKRTAPNLTKSLQKAFQSASDERTDSDVIVLLDPETMPVMHEIQLDQLDVVTKFRQSAGLSFNEAAERVGLDIPYRKERDQIWINLQEQRLDGLSPKDALASSMKEPTASPVEEGGELEALEFDDETDAAPDIEEKSIRLTADQKKQSEAIKKFIRDFRKLTLDSIDTGRLFRLTEADALMQTHLGVHEAMSKQIRLDYHVLKTGVDLADKELAKKAVKKFFNAKNRQFIKSFLSE